MKVTGVPGADRDDAPRTTLKRVLRTLVPKRLLKERDTVLRLGPKAGRIYAGLRMRNVLGVSGPGNCQLPRGARRFVFVCYGNIMRSPAAEALFKAALTEANLQNSIETLSAGMHAIPGNPAHPRAQIAAREMGFGLTEHRARLLSLEMVKWADILFVMDLQNQAELLEQYPDARHKVLLLGAYASPPLRHREIADPYFGDIETTRNCFRLLQVCIRNLIADLVSDSPARTEHAAVQA